MSTLLRWREKPFIEVATLQRGFDLPVQDRRDGTIPIFAANGPVGFHDVAKVRGPGVVTGRSGTLGKVHFAEKDYWPLNTALWVKDFHGNDPRWICRLLRWMKLERFTRGVGVPTLNRNLVHEVKVRVPPLAEQKRIAGILDAADALRAKRREALAQLDSLLQATFLDLFGDPVTNPKGWELSKLGELCDVRDGTHDTPKSVTDGFPLLTSKNFKDGQVNYDGAATISVEDFHQVNKRSKVDVGDLVMPMIGTIGNPVLIRDEPKFAIKNVALIKFTSKSPSNRYVRELLSSHYFDHITAGANRGGTQKFVALKDLRSIPVPVPSTVLQSKFNSAIEAIDRQRAGQSAHLAELDTLFASLQSRAFRGEL